jgi:hypothetical protein
MAKAAGNSDSLDLKPPRPPSTLRNVQRNLASHKTRCCQVECWMRRDGFPIAHRDAVFASTLGAKEGLLFRHEPDGPEADPVISGS